MAKGFSINELLQALQFAIVEAQEIAEDQHARQIAEYFDADGKPITVPLQIPNPHPRAGEVDDNGQEVAPRFVQLDVPKITLIPQNSIVIKELEMEMQVPIGNLLVEDEDWTADDHHPQQQNMSDEEWDKQVVKNRLGRRPSKRAMVDGKLRRLQINGKGSFFSKRNKQMAKLKIKFKGTEPPEVIARIEQSLVKNIET